MTELLTQHNTISFNNFIDKDLPIILGEIKNPLRILKNKDGDEFKTKIYILHDVCIFRYKYFYI